MKPRTLVLLLAAAIAAAPLAGAAGQAAPVTVRVLVPQTTSALPFLLMARDQRVAGVQLKVEFFANHAQALALLLRGEADLLLSGTSQGWENRLDGSPLVMLGTGVWGVSSLVGKDASIKGFADLKGKRVAIPFPGSPLDFQTRALLAFEKLDPDRDVTFVYGPVAQGLQRLQAGQVDAVAIPEPQATAMVKQQGLARLAVYAQAWSRVTGGDPMSPQVSLFSSSEWAEGHRALVADVLAAWDAASRAVNAAPADVAAAFAGALGVDAAILEEASRNTLLSVPTAADTKARVLSYYAAVAKYFPAGPRPLDERFFFLP